MKFSKKSISFFYVSFSATLFLLASLTVSFKVHAANYPLEIINVEETGANNRIRFAYPGIEYKVRTFAHGGAYPFVWSLTGNTTCGATINAANGEITWSNPQASDTGCKVEVRVTDSESTTDTESYTITVTDSTDRFVWMDAANEQAGRDGSAGNPYQNFSDFWAAGGHGGKIMYLRAGNYDFSGITGNNARGRGAYRITHSVSNHPIAFLAYPGASPSWSGTRGFAGTNTGKHWFQGGQDMYFYGIEFKNSYSYTFEIYGNSYSVWHNCVFDDYVSAYDYQNDSNLSWYNAGFTTKVGIGGNQFLGGTGNYATAIKHYNVNNQVIENNIFEGYSSDIAVSLKHGSEDNSIRGNIFNNNANDVGLGGYGAGSNRNEIAFNFSSGSSSSTVLINNAGIIGTNHIYRNTFLGSVWFRNMTNGDGPINIYNNVIINNDNHSSTTPHIRENTGEHWSITGETAVSHDQLMGSTSDNIVTPEGNLSSNFEQYIGLRGWQITKVSTPLNRTSEENNVIPQIPSPVNLNIKITQ